MSRHVGMTDYYLRRANVLTSFGIAMFCQEMG